MLKIERVSIFRLFGKIAILTVIWLTLYGCTGDLKDFRQAGREAVIFPDYSGVTFPPNIAPANFKIREDADIFIAKIHSAGKDEISVTSHTGTIRIPERKWKRLLALSCGKDIMVDIFTRKHGEWTRFMTITNHIASDPIDKYLVYRLIEPGFETWNRMGIYQRCLENYREYPVMTNDMSDGNCINCHSFCNNNSSTMMFHMRAQHSGTIIYRKGKLEKINTKTSTTISPESTRPGIPTDDI